MHGQHHDKCCQIPSLKEHGDNNLNIFTAQKYLKPKNICVHSSVTFDPGTVSETSETFLSRELCWLSNLGLKNILIFAPLQTTDTCEAGDYIPTLMMNYELHPPSTLNFPTLKPLSGRERVWL